MGPKSPGAILTTHEEAEWANLLPETLGEQLPRAVAEAVRKDGRQILVIDGQGQETGEIVHARLRNGAHSDIEGAGLQACVAFAARELNSANVRRPDDKPLWPWAEQNPTRGFPLVEEGLNWAKAAHRRIPPRMGA